MKNIELLNNNINQHVIGGGMEIHWNHISVTEITILTSKRYFELANQLHV